MLKDITLGQFFPGNTVAHRLDPRTKILLVVLYIVALFCAKSLLAYGILAAVLAVCVRISRVGIKSLVRGLKPVVRKCNRHAWFHNREWNVLPVPSWWPRKNGYVRFRQSLKMYCTALHGWEYQKKDYICLPLYFLPDLPLPYPPV